MSRVLVLDKNKQPLDPCPWYRARKLLKGGRAAVFRTYPFTIILKDRTVEGSVVHSHVVKVDPGSKVTGMAVLCKKTGRVVHAAEIGHRGHIIKTKMDARRSTRRGRRARKTRYRQPRFLNRKRKVGWLPPSLESRVANVATWVNRYCRLVPISAISMELVKFDTQKMANPEISGVEYQQGELQGYEVREYLLEKWSRKCAYCGKENVQLQVEHMQAKSKGGSNRISNLTLACEKCNTKKGSKDIKVFLKNKPELLNKLLAQAKAPLKDAAAVNITRWALFRRLKEIGLQIECGSGGRTKWNRSKQKLPKEHWIDAACVGASTPERLLLKNVKLLQIKAMGHGKRQRCITDKYGFQKQFCSLQKRRFGFQTGDMVIANILNGKNSGRHVGRIVTRASLWFSLGSVGVHPKYICVIQHADGYGYKNDG